MFDVRKLKSDDKIRNKVVILSGGLDSVYVLLKQIEKFNKEELDSIMAVHIEHFNILESKRKIETKTIKNIIEEIRKDFDVNIKLTTMSVNMDWISTLQVSEPEHTDGPICGGQTPLWLGCILNLIPNIEYKKCEVLMGENLSDDFSSSKAISIKEKVEETAKGMRPLDDEYEFKVGFPLILYRKSEIIDKMLKEFPKYYDLCWYCETPIECDISKEEDDTKIIDYKPCGCCAACITHTLALQQLIMENRQSGEKNREEIKSLKEKVKFLYEKKSEIEGFYKEISEI